MNQPLPTYGGQALIEGVMMRGTTTCAIAVRSPEGELILKTEPLGRLYQSRWAKVPFLRGLIVLWDALGLGMRALTFSANIQAGEDEQLEGRSLALTMALSLAMGLGLLFLLPAGAAILVEQTLLLQGWVANVLEGLIRLGLLIGYIWAIGRLPDIRRVYGYHGAEHMTINAFENGAPLTVESVAGFPREHPRCGTAFLLTVVVFSILVFSLIGPLPLVPRLVSRIALIPLLASLAYEYIRLTGRWAGRWWARPLLAANLALQRLTTRQPEPPMIEVAIAAFHAMREGEAESREEALHAA